jgi:hypothetical protein
MWPTTIPIIEGNTNTSQSNDNNIEQQAGNGANYNKLYEDGYKVKQKASESVQVSPILHFILYIY